MKRIETVCLLVHPESDFLQQTIWKGLVQVLGNENVAVYPRCEHFRGRVDDWYILDDGKKGCTAAPAHLRPEPDNGWTPEKILDNIEDFDAIILCSMRTYAMTAMQTLKELHRKLPPLVFVDGEDIGWSQREEQVLRRLDPKIVFKRELDRDIARVYPLPFAGFVDAYPEVDDTVKKYSVYAAFGNTWPARLRLLETLDEMNLPDAYLATNTEHRTDKMRNVQSLQTFEEYMNGIAQSKITFVMRGFGRDTLRAWEATIFNTCVFWCDPCIKIPHAFIPGTHIVQYPENLEGVKELVTEYLANDAKRMAIAQQGKEHARRWHTTEARARYMLEHIEHAVAGSLMHVQV